MSYASDDDQDTGTEISDVESTDSISQHHSSGSVVLRNQGHRTGSSFDGASIDLVQRMATRWVDEDEIATETERTNNSNSNSNMEPPASHSRHLSAQEEISKIHAEQDVLDKLFEEYIDPEQNGDVDVDEWVQGLIKLEVQLDEPEMRQIFKLIAKHDDEYIDKTDFITFVTLRTANKQVLELQAPILKAIRGASLHDKSHSNLFNPRESVNWTPFQIDSIETELLGAMQGMVTGLQEEVKKEQQFEEEALKHLEEHPEFLDPENPEEFNLATCPQWSKFEVCQWLLSLNMERYARCFADEGVDGAMLLNDLDEQMLIASLFVKPIHAKRIMREIHHIKLTVRGVTDIDLQEQDEVNEQNIVDLERMLQLKQIEIDLQNALDEVDRVTKSKDSLKKFYEKELQKLQTHIDTLTTENEQLQKKHQKIKKYGLVEDDVSSSSSESEEEEEEEVILVPDAMTVQKQQQQELEQQNQTHITVSPDVETKSEPDGDENEVKNDAPEVQAKSQTTPEPESTPDAKTHTQLKSAAAVRKKYNRRRKPSVFEKPLDSFNFMTSNKRLVMKQNSKLLKGLDKLRKQKPLTFCVEESDTIMEWSNKEVAQWMCRIGFSQYALAFYATPIDGDMLVRDLNFETLTDDLCVKKIHCKRILRQVGKLRAIINEGYDQVVCEECTIHLEPDLSRPTMDTIVSLQERVDELQEERAQLIGELENQALNQDENKGYFSQKIADLERERDELKDGLEGVKVESGQLKTEAELKADELKDTIQQHIAENEAMQQQIKKIKKEYRRKRRELDSDYDSDDSEQYEQEPEEKNDAESKRDEEVEHYKVEITVTKQEIQQKIHEEMQRIAKFGTDERVLDWTPVEVCNWLHTIQFDKYMELFYNTATDGGMLVQDVGSRLLAKWGVSPMHVKKLLREIQILRDSAIEQGSRIVLSQAIAEELDPTKAKQKDNDGGQDDKGNSTGKGGRLKRKKSKRQLRHEQEVLMVEQKLEQAQQEAQELREHNEELSKISDEEKQQRIGFELEVERLTADVEQLKQMGSDKKIATLESLIEYERQSKINSIEDLSLQINTLRKACTVMRKQLRLIQQAGFHPIDTLVSVLGYDTTRNKD